MLKRIKESHAVIGFLTKRDRIEGQNTYTTHKWVTDELAIAVGWNISVYEIREKNIEMQRGFTGDRQSLIIDDTTNKEVIFEGIKGFLNNVSEKREKLKRFRLAVTVFLILVFSLTWYFKDDIFVNKVITPPKDGEELPEVSETEDEEQEDIPEVDSLISGSISFKSHPNMDYSLEITPAYIDEDPSFIESISNVTDPFFQDTLALKPKEFYLSIQHSQKNLGDWVLASTGKLSTPYEPNQRLFFIRKSWYFDPIMTRIERNEPGDKALILHRLSELNWVEEDLYMWYRLKSSGCDYFFKNGRYDDLYKWCQDIERHKNFELVRKKHANNRKDPKFHFFNYWRKALRNIIEDKHTIYNSIDYKNIGYLSMRIIERDETIRSKVNYLMHRYNKHYGFTVTLSEEGLKFLLNV